jgi:hypothetical protein
MRHTLYFHPQPGDVPSKRVMAGVGVGGVVNLMLGGDNGELTLLGGRTPFMADYLRALAAEANELAALIEEGQLP